MGASRDVDLRRRRIDAVFARAKELTDRANSAEMQADYAKHLCVLISGHVEKSIGDLLLVYADGKTARPILGFLEAAVRRLTNMDTDRVLVAVGSLDHGWRVAMEVFIDDRRRQALNSVVGLRNDIAHGGVGSITLNQIERYWEAIQEVVDEVERLLGPPSRRRKPTA
jgi:hypothetical protein